MRRILQICTSTCVAPKKKPNSSGGRCCCLEQLCALERLQLAPAKRKNHWNSIWDTNDLRHSDGMGHVGRPLCRQSCATCLLAAQRALAAGLVTTLDPPQHASQTVSVGKLHHTRQSVCTLWAAPYQRNETYQVLRQA